MFIGQEVKQVFDFMFWKQRTGLHDLSSLIV